MLAQIRHQVQNTLHFLAAHPAGGAIGALGRIDKVPVRIILAGITVAHPHDHEQQDRQQANADQHPVHPIGRMENRGQAGKKIGRRCRRRCAVSGDAAALFPCRIVAQYLPQKAACIEDRKDGERRSDQACNEFLLVYGNNLPSNFVKSMV